MLKWNVINNLNKNEFNSNNQSKYLSIHNAKLKKFKFLSKCYVTITKYN